MESKTEEYRGYQIVVTPIKDHEDLWDFKYHITKIGDPAAASVGHAVSRRETLGGYTTAATACDAGIEVARIEVDNYLALSPYDREPDVERNRTFE
ncbi:MAG: hypothetical protein ACXU7D_04380 [Burkholderiaceae bacterium]